LILCTFFCRCQDTMVRDSNFYQTIIGLLRQVDGSFVALRDKFPNEVCCRPGCDDCCHACFSVSCAEALLLRHALTGLSDSQKKQLVKRAETAENEFHVLENKIRSQRPDAKKEIVGTFRLRCPLLVPGSCQCLLYDYRPITCRVYGLPTSIGNQGHVCGLSGFAQGRTYPTIKLDNLNQYLDSLSEDVVRELGLSINPGHRYFIHQLVLQDKL